MRSLLFSVCVSLSVFSACRNPFEPWPFTCQAPLTSGSACEEDGDCEERLICHPTLKTCAEKFPQGADCVISAVCADGLVCTLNPDKFQCFSKDCDAQGQNCRVGRATGNRCPDRKTCPNNELCMLDPLEASGFCQPRLRAGQSCEDATDGKPCEGDLACLSSNLCGPPSGVGEACPRGAERCPNGLVCLDRNNGRRTCETPIAVGQPCQAGGECEKGAFCDLGRLVCTALRNVGDECPNGNECGETPFDEQRGVDCVRGRCVDTSKEGAECGRNRPSQCTSGRVCRRTQG